jgi:hypothetical protein
VAASTASWPALRSARLLAPCATLLGALLAAACGARTAAPLPGPDLTGASVADPASEQPEVTNPDEEGLVAEPDARLPRGESDVETASDAPEQRPDASAERAHACEEADASGWLGLPEASGAVRFPDGALLVVADSGLHGEARWVRPDGTEAAVRLPLDGPRGAGDLPTDDDLEGLSRGPDGDLFGITSAGWMRRWRRVGEAFEQVGEAWPLSPEETLACASRAVNCGPNYEGLCLRPRAASPPSSGGTMGAGAGRADGGTADACLGFAASKARGALVCLVEDARGLLVASGLELPTGLPADQLSDCAFPEASDAVGPSWLLLAGNLHASSGLWWFDPARGPESLQATGVNGPPNQEAVVALGAGRWRTFGDLQGFSPTSPWLDLRCGTP